MFSRRLLGDSSSHGGKGREKKTLIEPTSAYRERDREKEIGIQVSLSLGETEAAPR